MRYFLCLFFAINIAWAEDMNYRDLMRHFIQSLSQQAKSRNPNFLIIPQNGQELMTEDGREVSPPVPDYLNAIDGQGRESLFYGYTGENKRTPPTEEGLMEGAIKVGKRNGKTILIIDYTNVPNMVDDAHRLNEERGYISFTAPGRNMTHLPETPYKSNELPMNSLGEVQNFAVILNLSEYPTRESFLKDMEKTNYDLIITDAFFNDGTPWTSAEIARLKVKPNGARRLVASYISIGEAESYRYYWQSSWKKNPPSWLACENPNWPENYNVKYWDPAWQNIVHEYLNKILDAGFDGIYMDIVDAFYIHEEHLCDKAQKKKKK